MGISDRKRSIDVPVSINLDLTQEPKPNQFLIDNNIKGGDFVSRKKSGNILAGSKLNVEGQGIFNVKIFKNEIIKKHPIVSPGSEGIPPTPSVTPVIILTTTPTPTPSITPTVTSTITPTPSTTPPASFLSVWRTTGSTESITLPYTVSGTYSGTIDWGDGNTSTNSYANRTHTYSTPGDYTVTIYGTTDGWSFNNTGDKLKIREILRWGPWKSTSVSSNFYGCSNLVLTGVTDTPDLSTTTNLTAMFYGCSSITSINNINSWNISNITNINSMFRGCTNWDDNIGNWDVSNVVIFTYAFRATKFDNGGSNSIGDWIFKNGASITAMFYESTYFNRDVGNWDLSNVNGDIDSLFYGATSFNNGGSPSISGWTMSGITSIRGLFSFTPFNQNINSWDVSNVTNMNITFWFASSFNQPLSGWNTNNVTTMTQTFSNASSFNQPIGNWGVSGVTDMSFMFNNATLFNQNIGDWNVSGVTLMNSMFAGATVFNQNLGNWDVSKVTNFNSMFSNAIVFNNAGSPSISGWTINTTSGVTMAAMFATANQFNQPIGSWDVSKVTDMNQMFYLCPLFNQSLSGWNVSNVTNMSQMFQSSSSTSFNQDIGNWNISGVTNFTSFMFGKTPLSLSTTNLDSIYNGWPTKTPQTGLTINFGSAKYTSASSAGKAILTGSTGSGGYEWTITDGGI